MKNIDNGTIVRTVVLFVALLNQTLVLIGFSPLPFENEQVENFITILLTVVASVWAWWQNNAITRKARRNEEILKKEGLK
ncbi:phage holin [Domibacillus mangrovi]|uniref:Phage holin n=1 Tax=Domibacillus mangrovi TaxID=1714354 RepID=A0A1Q5P471_9BACI|nr:phage holin [Domibacillus mangrovi]OKL36983.1 phage holin [Domibacillus mangrovi]